MQAEPNWTAVYEWAQNMAWKMKPNNQWVDELASAAVCHLLEVWQKYRDLTNEEFKKNASVIMYHKMLAILADDNSRGTRVTAQKINLDVVTCQPKHHSTEEDALQNFETDNHAQATEVQIDFKAVHAAARRLLKPTEMRVMQIVFRDFGATASEIAAELGDITEGAVRTAKCNAMKKLKCFFSKDINENASRMLR